MKTFYTSDIRQNLHLPCVEMVQPYSREPFTNLCTFDGLAVSLMKKNIVRYGRWSELDEEIYEYAEKFGRDDFHCYIVETGDDGDDEDD